MSGLRASFRWLFALGLFRADLLLELLSLGLLVLLVLLVAAELAGGAPIIFFIDGSGINAKTVEETEKDETVVDEAEEFLTELLDELEAEEAGIKKIIYLDLKVERCPQQFHGIKTLVK